MCVHLYSAYFYMHSLFHADIYVYVFHCLHDELNAIYISLMLSGFWSLRRRLP